MTGRAEEGSRQRGREVSNSLGAGAFGDEGQLVIPCGWSVNCMEGKKRDG